MELYHLRTFVTVAEEQHLTRASERLFTSQPAISAHIKALEEELGVTLFDRTPRGMQLTPAGALLLDRARQALAAAGDFLQHARSIKDELIGTLRIGLNTDACFLRLLELQGGLSERHPRLEIEFHAGSTGANIPALRVGKLDASFVSGECDDPLLASYVLCEEELAVAVPERMRESIGPADIHALARHPWVFTSPDCAYYGVMRALFEAHDCAPVKTVMANQDDALRAMVAGGVGLGILRRVDIEEAAKSAPIYALPLELPTVSLRFAHLRTRANDPVIRAAVAELSRVWSLALPVREQAV